MSTTGNSDSFPDDTSSDGFSLESIMAEYKGSALISGDKRTPKQLLDEETNKIVSEVNLDFNFQDTVMQDVETEKIASEADLNYDSQDTIMQDVEKAIERELGYNDEFVETRKKGFGRFVRTEKKEEAQEEPQEEPAVIVDETFEEPDLWDATRRFSRMCDSISLRCIPAALVTIFMVILTLAFEAEMIIPFGIGRSQPLAVCVLMIALLTVMLLLSDLIFRGAWNLTRGIPNVETLVLFSCAFSLISATYTVLSDSVGIMTYCAVSALSLTFAAFGEKSALSAITETLKTASGSSEPFGVLADYITDIDKSVLKKVSARTDGFYNNLMHIDVSEAAYRYATPVLLTAALALSIIIALTGGRGDYFLHILSGLLAAAAPFSAMISYSVPFGIVTRAIRKSGAAIAGWGGADEIWFTDGACVTDEDLFPPGMISFHGLKLYGSVEPKYSVSYAASLIIASGSGLSRVFLEALKSQKLDIYKVEDFVCYEGGIGGLVRGERVMTGSAAFMNLLGVRVPDDMNMKNAVFTSVGDELSAAFTVEYTPVHSVQAALISILKWRIKLFFAVRDFNVTPLMLEQKFKVSLEDIEYIQARDTYNISDLYSGKEGRISAVLTREGMGPFAEAVTGGRLLRSSALVSTAISIASASLGVIIMFYLFWMGSYLSAKPGNLILFMLSMLAAVLLVCGYARCRK